MIRAVKRCARVVGICLVYAISVACTSSCAAFDASTTERIDMLAELGRAAVEQYGLDAMPIIVIDWQTGPGDLGGCRRIGGDVVATIHMGRIRSAGFDGDDMWRVAVRTFWHEIGHANALCSNADHGAHAG